MPRFVDGAASIILDDSASPILLATSMGVTTEKLARESFGWLREFATGMHARHQRYVVIIDARAAGRPQASVRALISKLTDELRQLAPDVELASVFIAENALIRGALTAIIWVSRSSWQPLLVPSWDEALRRATEVLRAAGIEVPRVPSRYRTPA